MNYELAVVGFMVIIICSILGAYCLGKADAKKGRQKLYNDLVTERAVRHNLNCLVGDLKTEVKFYKADAAAYRQSVGLWCTDQPDLIKHHAKKERFFRLGYPEHKL